ncbi:MAG: hypothetical protein PHQ74_10250 [Crocinitomicaceae bacterium]|nr:hypothetical protein [Crocinitomicaceae bacterium]
MKITLSVFFLFIISGIFSQTKKQEEKYQHHIQLADQQYANRNYEEAIQNYELSLTIKMAELYPLQRINQILGIIEQQKEIDAKVTHLYKLADSCFTDKHFDQAHTYYMQIITIKASEDLAKKRLLEIDRIRAKKQDVD